MERTDDFRSRYNNTRYQGAGRQSFSHPRTSYGGSKRFRSSGAAGHWIHLLSVAAPLVIGEAVKDADKRWKAMRAVSVGTAILSEAAWTWRVSQDRKREEESRRALEACEERGP